MSGSSFRLFDDHRAKEPVPEGCLATVLWTFFDPCAYLTRLDVTTSQKTAWAIELFGTMCKHIRSSVLFFSEFRRVTDPSASWPSAVLCAQAQTLVPSKDTPPGRPSEGRRLLSSDLLRAPSPIVVFPRHASLHDSSQVGLLQLTMMSGEVRFDLNCIGLERYWYTILEFIFTSLPNVLFVCILLAIVGECLCLRDWILGWDLEKDLPVKKVTFGGVLDVSISLRISDADRVESQLK
uniref:Uncharacterized protein n=1 Tax=Steinernema glaseri TaxID=37863 RepID=A0A1I7ZGH1_9BILA